MTQRSTDLAWLDLGMTSTVEYTTYLTLPTHKRISSKILHSNQHQHRHSTIIMKLISYSRHYSHSTHRHRSTSTDLATKPRHNPNRFQTKQTTRLTANDMNTPVPRPNQTIGEGKGTKGTQYGNTKRKCGVLELVHQHQGTVSESTLRRKEGNEGRTTKAPSIEPRQGSRCRSKLEFDIPSWYWFPLKAAIPDTTSRRECIVSRYSLESFYTTKLASLQ